MRAGGRRASVLVTWAVTGAALAAGVVLGGPRAFQATLATAAAPAAAPALFNDSHFHLTNYIQQGPTIDEFLRLMGTKVGRVDAVRHPAAAAVVVRELRRLRADLLPADRRAALLLLVHRRVHRACAYRSLTPAEQARFDPMITGFNPADMYAADHIRRVLTTFPGVFSGIGEFTHPQGVRLVEDRRRGRQPDRTRRSTASSTSPARSGSSCILHNDIDMPFAKAGRRARLPDRR